MADSPRGRWPLGLLGMLGLALAVERGLARLDLDLMEPWHWDWQVAGKAARREAKWAEVLCLGDSLVKFGVQPVVLEGRLKRRAYNLALCLGQPPSSYFLLRRALAAGARPAALLINAAPHLLARGPRYNLRQWPELLTTSELLELARTARDPDLFTATMLGRLTRAVRARHEVRASLLAALRGESTSRRFQTPQFQRNWRVNRGANVAPPIQCQGDPETWARALFPAWACDPVNRAYLDRLLSLAAARRIPIYWLLTPISPEVQAVCERNGFDADQTRFVRDWQARFPNVVVLDARRSRYPQATHTDDPIHLNRFGASTLSADVADALARRDAEPAASRWVELPAYRERADVAPLEDYRESGVALQQRWSGARR
jgi:hypothetical protein